jgi:hypothetical protein
MTGNDSTVLVRLLGEGTVVYRPCPATRIADKVYRLGTSEGYDPEDEHWEFPPGSTVRCEATTLDGSMVMVAVAGESD